MLVFANTTDFFYEYRAVPGFSTKNFNDHPAVLCGHLYSVEIF